MIEVFNAKWIGEDHFNDDNELLATKDDKLEIHGKHVSDGEWVVKGTRSEIFFWAKPENVEVDESLLPEGFITDQPLI